MKILKILSINIALFFITIGLVELFCGSLFYLLHRKPPALPLASSFDYYPIGLDNHISLTDPCVEMRTDVLLTNVPRAPERCFILDGVAEQDYVIYPHAPDFTKTILILGGSTSAGFYQHYANGLTWPLLLSRILGPQYRIINGAIGGYDSSQELLKFMRDGPRFDTIDIVLSLSGINDMPDSQGPNLLRGQFYPFLTKDQDDMNRLQKWIDQRTSPTLINKTLPNLHWLVKAFTEKMEAIEKDSNTSQTASAQFFNFQPVADRWEANITRMSALVALENAKYMIFLQPTMGLEGGQATPRKNSRDAKIYDLLPKTYYDVLNQTYHELRERCAAYSFCLDISHVAPPTGNMYTDPRHHNENGNLLIAQAIARHIQKSK